MDAQDVTVDDARHLEELLSISVSSPGAPSRSVPFASGFEDFSNLFTCEVTFETRAEAVTWVQATCRARNFVLVTKKSDAGGNGRRGRVTIACERSGTYRGASKRVGVAKAKLLGKISQNVKNREEDEDNTRPNTGKKKFQCPFLIEIKEFSDSKWYVGVVSGKHNHDTAKYLEGHSLAGRLNEDEALILDKISKENVKPRQILNTLRQRDANNASTLQTIYNARKMNRIKDTDGRSEMQQLLHLLENHMYLSWHRRDTETNVVTYLFWAHPDSIK